MWTMPKRLKKKGRLKQHNLGFWGDDKDVDELERLRKRLGMESRSKAQRSAIRISNMVLDGKSVKEIDFHKILGDDDTI